MNTLLQNEFGVNAIESKAGYCHIDILSDKGGRELDSLSLAMEHCSNTIVTLEGLSLDIENTIKDSNTILDNYSLEGLSDDVLIDYNLEGIKEVISSIWKKIKEFIKIIRKKVGDLFESHDAKIKKSLKNLKVNANKLDSMTGKRIKKVNIPFYLTPEEFKIMNLKGKSIKPSELKIFIDIGHTLKRPTDTFIKDLIDTLEDLSNIDLSDIDKSNDIYDKLIINSAINLDNTTKSIRLKRKDLGNNEYSFSTDNNLLVGNTFIEYKLRFNDDGLLIKYSEKFNKSNQNFDSKGSQKDKEFNVSSRETQEMIELVTVDLSNLVISIIDRTLKTALKGTSFQKDIEKYYSTIETMLVNDGDNKDIRRSKMYKYLHSLINGSVGLLMIEDKIEREYINVAINLMGAFDTSINRATNKMINQ